MEISEKMDKPQLISAWQKIQTYFNVLNHILVSIVAVYMTCLCYRAGNKPISWHAWLCTIGYQLLMTEAILSFYSQNAWSKYHTKSVKRYLHWILQSVGSISAIVGMIIEFINRGTHFQSKHSIVGLIAGIFTLIGMLNGVSALWSIELRKYVAPIYLKCFHNLTGITAFVLGMIALFFGYDKRYMIKNSEEEIRLSLQALALITIALTLFGALKSLLSQVKTILR